MTLLLEINLLLEMKLKEIAETFIDCVKTIFRKSQEVSLQSDIDKKNVLF